MRHVKYIILKGSLWFPISGKNWLSFIILCLMTFVKTLFFRKSQERRHARNAGDRGRGSRIEIRKWWRERKDSNSNHDWVNSNPFLLFLRDKREIKVLAVSFLFPHKTRPYTRTGYTENWKCSWKQSHYFAFSTDTYFKIIDIIEPEWIFSTDRLSL